MQTLLQDLRFGLRTLWRQPLFAVAAILVLALGIGANIAVFSVIDSVLLQPLPYPHSDRLTLGRENIQGIGLVSLSYPEYVDWQAGTKSSFSDLALERRASFNVAFQAGDGNPPERVAGGISTANLLGTLDLNPLVGRDFQASDDVPGAAPAVLIGEKLWRDRFAADPRVVGRTITVDGINRQVIGVLPPQLDVPHNVQMLVPLADLRKDPGTLNRGNHQGFRAVGRLQPGVTLAQAQADINRVDQELKRLYPDSNANGSRPSIQTLLEGTVGDYHNSLYLLLGAVGCVLLIACANVANLQLARATARQKELAVRAALGATRWRLVRQLLTEGVLLSFLAAALAILLALWALDAIVALVPAGLPRFNEVRLGLPALGYAALVALGTGLLVGIWPAWRMSARNVMASALRQGNARGGTGGPGQHRMRALLVVGQMTLAVVLLAGAGLTLRAFYQALTAPLGFNPHQLLTLSVSLPTSGYDQARRDQFVASLLDQVRALPGVASASVAGNVPFDDSNGRGGFHVTGTPPTPHNADSPTAEDITCTPGYFQTMEIPLRRGRDFGPQDTAKQPQVLIVDESFVKAYFPNQDPIGQHVDDERGDSSENRPPYTIVGVVAHVETQAPAQQDDHVPPYQFYFPIAQTSDLSPTLAVRVGAGDPLRLTESIRQIVTRLDSSVPIANVDTMEGLIGKEFAPRRLTMTLLGVFGGLALVLASIGLYGVTALGVAQRTRELGIRLALGAGRGNVLRLILGQGMALVAGGLVIGLVVAVIAGRVLASVFYGFNGSDPATLAGVSVVLGGAALLACWVPAQRATRVDPMVALRDE